LNDITPKTAWVCCTIFIVDCNYTSPHKVKPQSIIPKGTMKANNKCRKTTVPVTTLNMSETLQKLKLYT
jgi:hypothetical protein